MALSNAPNVTNALRFTPEGSFKISLFSDLHYGESTNTVGPPHDAHTADTMAQILSAENPQLAVLNGDLITGRTKPGPSNSSLYIDSLVAPLTDRHVRWASVYGNHESDRGLCPDDLLERETTNYPHASLTRKMVDDPDAGITNYYLPVWSSENNNNNSSSIAPELILWFFDSRGGQACEEAERPGSRRPNWVDDSVVHWFTQTRESLQEKYNRTVPSLAFFHIPTYAMRAFQEASVGGPAAPGLNHDIVKQQGYMPGVQDYREQDYAFMEALLDTDGLIATFSGHDHGNDWCFRWDSQLPYMNLTGNGLHMCYGRRTGYGGYGGWARGGRQIELLLQDEGPPRLDTWVRVQDGTVGERTSIYSSSDSSSTTSQGSEYLGTSAAVKRERWFVFRWVMVWVAAAGWFVGGYDI
ncbi:metallophosphoesterase family protein [Aspergillus candidus]|uniref:Metallo-dependent phosphatase n=1 Tax=Aspergillus candidus TaxID=41067 RepID=A0A2I2FCG6_ASPCN|nr:Metallo-dependent phosphatase [Aspergillus candidus]PLB38326.1 Metallo-dependent phosphatase [Aspergillus candidus]